MEGGALSEGGFKEWGRDYVLFCHITSYVKEEKHPDLLSRKGGGGFPYFVVMNEKGNVLAKHEWPRPRSVEGFTSTAKEAEDFQRKLDDLKKKAAAGDMDAKVEYFEIRMDLAWIGLKEARAEMKNLRLTKAQREDLEEKLVNMEVNEILGGVTGDKKTQIEAGKKFAELEKVGRIPTEVNEIMAFWIYMMDYAESRKDAKLFEKALEALKKKFGDNPRAKPFLQKKEGVLTELREKGDE